MDQRLTLHEKLSDILGTREVYFQPPESIRMTYPAIVYQRDNSWTRHANNSKYAKKKRYQVTVIDRDPDSPIPDQVEDILFASFQRFFVTQNLNHTVFNVYI